MTQAPSSRPLAVVTGASSGIGLELVRQLAGRGYDVIGCAEDVQTSTTGTRPSDEEGTVRTVRADLSSGAGVQTLVTEVLAEGRPVDVLALNAGVGVGGPFLETALEDDERLIALNVTSVVQVAKRLVPDMVARGSGRVLVTASVAALMPGPWYATYAASKAFLQSWAQALRHELKDTGVTVTALMPGPTDTDFFRRAGLLRTVVGGASKDDPADVARDGLQALLAGKDQVIAHSRLQRMQAGVTRLLPERAKAAVHAQLTRRRGSSG